MDSYQKLKDSDRNCCFPNNKNKEAAPCVVDAIEYAQKLIRARNAKKTGLWQKQLKLTEQARQRYRLDDKMEARSLLKRAKMVEQKRARELQLIEQLESMILKLDETHAYVVSASAMQKGALLMDDMVSEATVEHVQEVMDQWMEANARADEVMNEMAYNDVDIDEELQLLLEVPEEELVLPDVPKNRVKKNNKQAVLT